MPLEAHVNALFAKLKAFVTEFDPPQRTFVLRTAPELMQHSARLLEALEKETKELFSAQPGAGDDPATYFHAWAEDLRAQVDRARRRARISAWSELAVPVDDASLPVVPRFVAWFEMLARELAPVARKVVLLAFVDDGLEPAIVDALRAFAEQLSARRVRLILIDARREPMVRGDWVRASRVRVASLVAARHDPRTVLGEFLNSPTERLFVVTDGAANVSALLSAVAPQAEMLSVATAYEGAAITEHALDAHLDELLIARKIGRHAWDDPEYRGLHVPPIERITARMSRLRRAAATQLIVTIDLGPIAQPDHAATWVDRLAAECSDPRVKLIVIDSLDQPLAPHLKQARSSALTHGSFMLSAREIARGAAAKLKRAELPPRERFNMLLLLAGFASGQQKFNLALQHARAAEALVPLTAQATDAPMAALSLANIHYRRADFAAVRAVLVPAIESANTEPDAARMLSPMIALLAGAHLQSGTYEDAAALYELAARLDHEHGNVVIALHHDIWRGEALRRLSRNDEARAIWLDVLELARRIGPDLRNARATLESETLQRLSALEAQAGNPTAANDFHHRAAACCTAHTHLAHNP